MMGMQYDSKNTARQERLDAHILAEDAIQSWDSQISVIRSHNLSKNDKENKIKLEQMIKELEIK